MVSPEIVMLSVFITPCTNPIKHPSSNQRCLDGGHRFEQRQVGSFGIIAARQGSGERSRGRQGVATARRSPVDAAYWKLPTRR
jgi:hypothetical protein